MNPSSNIRILLISGETAFQDDVLKHLRDASHYSVTKLNAAQLPADLADQQPDVVITDLDKLEDAELQWLSAVRGQLPHTPIIVVSHELDREGMRQLFRFHIDDWLPKPVDGENLGVSVRSSVRSSKVNKNRVHAVISAVGGAGASTTAVSMADIAVSKLFRKKTSVALFDLDFSTGNCSYLLNMVSSFNLASVVTNPRRIDSEFVRVIQQEHKKGFHLYSFKHPELNTDLNGYELVLRLLDAVNLEHDHTFLDVPYYETEWKNDVLSAVNTCTIVTELNLPAIKHTLDTVARVRSLHDANFPIRVLINKRRGGLFNRRISQRELKELFGNTPLFYLPQENNLIGEAADRGMLPSEISSTSAFNKSLTKYMRSIELSAEASA